MFLFLLTLLGPAPNRLTLPLPPHSQKRGREVCHSLSCTLRCCTPSALSSGVDVFSLPGYIGWLLFWVFKNREAVLKINHKKNATKRSVSWTVVIFLDSRKLWWQNFPEPHPYTICSGLHTVSVPYLSPWESALLSRCVSSNKFFLLYILNFSIPKFKQLLLVLLSFELD